MLKLLFTLMLCLAGWSASAAPKYVIGTLSDYLAGQQRESAIERELGQYLADDDIIGAKDFVDSLADEEDIAEGQRRLLEDRIWRTKAQRMLDYARKIREAIKASDLEAMREYSGRMQRLMGKAQDSPQSASETVLDAETDVSAASTSPKTPEEPMAPAESGARSVTDEKLDREAIENALSEGRLFSPEEDNAFDLAAVRLDADPENVAAGEAMGRIIETATASAENDLEGNALEDVLAEADALLIRFRPAESSSGEGDWRSAYHAEIAEWRNGLRSQAIANLIRRGEAAIDSDNLTIAPEGTDSALSVIERLIALDEDGAEGARTLGQEVVDRYQALIDRNIERGRLDIARTFADRMAWVDKTAKLETDQVESSLARIDDVLTQQQRHERLLRQASQLRDRGQLVAPIGSNALAFAAEAVKLAFNPSAAQDVLDDVIVRQRRRIDRLEEAGRLRDAARELETLAGALQEADIEQTALAFDFRARATALFRRADQRDSERERRAAAEQRRATAPQDDDGDDEPFTFINPF